MVLETGYFCLKNTEIERFTPFKHGLEEQRLYECKPPTHYEQS
jgi:hypothetical protein